MIPPPYERKTSEDNLGTTSDADKHVASEEQAKESEPAVTVVIKSEQLGPGSERHKNDHVSQESKHVAFQSQEIDHVTPLGKHEVTEVEKNAESAGM